MDLIVVNLTQLGEIMEKLHPRQEYYLSLVFVLLAVVFWGYSFISTKIVLTELPPVSIAFFRQIIATVILLGWLFLTGTPFRATGKNLLLLAGSGFFGIVLYFVCENNGLQYTTASNAAMIVAAVPIFTLISEILFFKFQPRLSMWLFLLLSVFGVYLVISVNGQIDLSSTRFKGNIIVLGAMVSWVIYTIINKRVSEHFSSFELIAYQSLASVFLYLPFIIPEIPRWRVPSPVSWLNLVYLGIFCSALSYFFYIYAIKRLGPTVSAAFLNLIPVVAVLCGYFLLGERLAWIQVVGMGLIMVSLYKMSLK